MYCAQHKQRDWSVAKAVNYHITESLFLEKTKSTVFNEQNQFIYKLWHLV